ncbi:MAG TPA: hypothetical protein PLW35_12495 [Verrucomicrobiota bacterium]|nr:hypothetical protein [Verrucomicrobiota bacterium]
MNRTTRELPEVQGVKSSLTNRQAKPNRVVNTNRLRKKAFAVLRRVSAGAIVVLFSLGLKAGTLSTINAYIGFAKTLKSTVGELVGGTTVTPACALGRWDYYVYGIYGKTEDGKPKYFGQHWQAIRNPYTGEYFYREESRDERTGRWHEVRHEPISIPSLSRATYTCVLSPNAQMIYNRLEDFSIQVWAASVKKTGYFPPKEPYTAYMKCDATSRQCNCAHMDFMPQTTKIRSAPIQLRDSGIVTVKMPIVQYEYSFPPLLWVGDWKDY